ncbi:MAG: hypothetical protein DI536_10555 [Archangium gephyra]|uniref:Uncharacterized protein n=1 Tax=Archangium gephyra TaxID=48 RepID=A0A2W5UZ65_9BACT|nr:MAG: hypothetical protein DI536_10555 [Archangium gephyra]
MADLSETDLEKLERYDGGAMSAEEKSSFERELEQRPELRDALAGARAMTSALPRIPETMTDERAAQLVQAALPREAKSPARWWPLLLAAGLMAFGYFRFGVDTVESLGGPVTVDARTVVAGESVVSGNLVITAQSSAAFVRRRSSKWTVVPSSRVLLRGNVLEKGAVVISGRAPLSAGMHAIDIDGEAVISLEPLEGSFRETSHLEPGDVMNQKVLRTAMGAAAIGGLSLYVLSGDVWVTPPDAMPTVRVEAGKSWNVAAPSKTTKVTSPFEQWSTEVPRPIGVTERLDAGTSQVVVRSRDGEASPSSSLVPLPVIHATTRDGIQDAVQSVMPEIWDCYHSWSQQQSGLGGSISFSFVIAASDGGVGTIRDIGIVDGGLGLTALDGCVLNVMSGLSFEAPSSPLNVTYPMKFSHRPPDAGP